MVRRNAVARTLLVAAVLLSPSLSRAQATTDTTKLEAVVVTATRSPLSIGDIPASVTVLNGADLRARGIVAVSDALREVPGVTVSQTGSFGGQTSLFVRGGQSNFIKVLIDGVPVNQAGVAFDFSTLTTDNVDRIEIVRGPSSVVWGSDAVTGVINIITRSGRGGPRMSISARAGSYGTTDADAQVSQSSGSNTYSLGIGHHSSTGIYDFNNQYGETVLSGRADAAIDDKTTASFTVHYLDDVAHFPTDGTGAVVDSNQYTTISELAVGAKVRRLMNSWLTVQGTLTSASDDGGDDDAAGRGNPGSFETLDHITRRGVEGRAIAALGRGSVLTVGGQVEEQAQRSQEQQAFGSSSEASFFTVTRHDDALFAELLSTVSRLTTTLGGRVDGDKEFGRFGTYRAAAQYAFVGSLTIRGSIGTAFREPSLFENFATGFTTGNPNLQPEHSRSAEVGVGTGLPGERAHLQITYFNQRFVNLIDYDGATLPGQPNYTNIAKATADGAEIELSHAPMDGFYGDISYTRLGTRVIEPGFSTAATASFAPGQPLLRRPANSGSGHVGYVGIPRLRLDAVVTYVGDRRDQLFSDTSATLAVTQPSYTLLDVSAEYTLPTMGANSPDYTLTFRGANLGGAKYESVAGFRSPRTVILIGARIAK